MADIKMPITVDKIDFEQTDSWRANGLTAKCGDMVAVRPCAEKFGNRTFLGVFIGEVPLSQGVKFKDGVLTVMRGMHNPMIFIPEVNEVVFGCGSWWKKIKSEDQLRQITDGDIQNVWYVKAARQLAEVGS